MSGEQGQANPGGQPGSAGEGLLEADPLKAVVGLLRKRASRARGSAWVFLWILNLTVVAGLAFYLLLPFWENYVDAREATLEGIQAEIAEEDAKVDTDRAALLSGSGTFDTGNRGLASLLRNQWEPVEVRRLAAVAEAAEESTYVARARDLQAFASIASLFPPGRIRNKNLIIENAVLIYESRGTILRSIDGGISFEVLALPTDQHLSGHVILDDTVLLYGERGTILRSSDGGANFQLVETQPKVHLTGHIALHETLLLFDEQGTILRSTNRGATFETVHMLSESELSPSSPFFFTPAHHVLLDDVVLIQGGQGKILRSSDGGATFQIVETQLHSISGHIVLDEILLMYDQLGMIIRSTNKGISFETVQERPNFTRILNVFDTWKHVVLNESILFYSAHGRMLRSIDDGKTFQVLHTQFQDGINGHILMESALLIYDRKGMVMRSTDDGVTFKTVQSGFIFDPLYTDGRAWNHTIFDDLLLIFSPQGTVLRSGDSGITFEAVQAPALADTHIVFDGGMLVYNSNGISAVSFGNMKDFIEVSLITNRINGHIFLDGRLLIYDFHGNVFRLSNRWHDEFRAISPSLGTRGETTLSQFLDNLPEHIREWEPLQELRAELDGIINRRSALSILEERTDARLAELDEFPYAQWRREQLRLDLATFLATCRGQEDFGSEITQACLAAWQDRLASGEGWWRVLADQIPPGILILFLLATTGSLYRYNLRLAGFHDSRADALELLARGRDKDSLRDLLAVTPGDAVNLATIFLGADKVEMGAIRAKLGQAEVELAKTLRASEN